MSRFTFAAAPRHQSSSTLFRRSRTPSCVPATTFSTRVVALIAFLLALACGPILQADDEAAGAETDSLRVVSFNVRYGTANDGDNRWELRKTTVVEAIRAMAPDVMGTQEMQRFQAEYLRSQLPEYAYVGKSREPGNEMGEECGIFFRKDRFNDLEQGHFWLSENPDQPGSKSWDSSLPRMASWVKLYDQRRKEPFVFVNTHFDHRGREARLESAKLLHHRATQISRQLPLIVTGDFNCGEGSEPYQAIAAPTADDRLLLDSYRAVHSQRSDDEGTFNGFQGRRSGSRIDWILVGPPVKVESAKIETFEQDGRYPSDHFPVSAVVNWPRQ